ncbi:deoxyribonuclease IV [Paludisphaera mucosa]|uniref:Probable endonuclease 4 n=1 Tax=Paludisphaera mucosa TaxID=3030827 RepID=A0ABT6F9B4_9BACT|nr:deoxyribonuclease IV [Paludisphaera mucosa]MDG3004173.1 deoxyribonuclease IV [Paludisphaera mucosa]
MPRKPKPTPPQPAAPAAPGLKLGAHMSIAGGYDRAVRAAHAVGFETVQLFTKNNNQWNAPPITDAQADAFRAALAETGVVDPISHASYLINLASPDDVLWNRSIDALAVEVERCARLGIADLVVHPGAHVGAGEEEGLRRVAQGLDRVIAKTAGLAVTIDLETTAGQGTCLGHRFEHLQAILELTAGRSRLGVCVDTCHIFAAGYSLDVQDLYDGTFDELDRAVGLDLVRVLHLNDSRRERASRVDRHAGIGVGMLGLEPFRFVLNDPRLRGLPMILETPKGVEDGEDLDARNRRVLRGLLAS